MSPRDRRALILLLVALVSILLIGCSDDGEEVAPSTTTSMPPTTTTTAPTTTTAAPATTTTSESAASSLLEALKATYELPGTMEDVELHTYTVSGEWAGAVIRAWWPEQGTPSDPLPVLLKRSGSSWEIIAEGTGLTLDEWVEQGAPAEIAEWLDLGWYSE